MNNRYVGQDNEAKANSILIQEKIFKIPKHNEKGLKPSIILEIMHDWHNKHFSDYDVVGGFLHRDERTSKGNTVDDHYHQGNRMSGFRSHFYMLTDLETN